MRRSMRVRLSLPAPGWWGAQLRQPTPRAPWPAGTAGRSQAHWTAAQDRDGTAAVDYATAPPCARPGGALVIGTSTAGVFERDGHAMFLGFGGSSLSDPPVERYLAQRL